MNSIFNIRYFILSATLVSLAACSGGGSTNQEPPAGDAAICFSAAETPQARSAALEGHNTTFDVWAWKTLADASEQAVMWFADGSAYQAAYTASQWRYDTFSGQYLKYWDLAASLYTFTAVSPHPTGAVTASVDATHHVSVNGVTANSSSATDWLIAHYTRANTSTVTDTDLLASSSPTSTQPNLTADVPLPFHHILSMVEYRAYCPSGVDAEITSVTVTTRSGETIYTSGNYSENRTGATGWKDTNLNWAAHSGSATNLLTLNPSPAISLAGAVSPQTSKHLASVLEIPQPFGDEGLPVTVTITANGKTISNDFNFPVGWNTDTRHIYIFAIDLDEEIILVELNVEDYHWQEGDEINTGTQTNW